MSETSDEEIKSNSPKPTFVLNNFQYSLVELLKLTSCQKYNVFKHKSRKKLAKTYKFGVTEFFNYFWPIIIANIEKVNEAYDKKHLSN